MDRNVEGAWAPHAVRGELVKVTADSLTLLIHASASPVSFALDSIRGLEISRGVSRGRTAIKFGLQAAPLWGAMSLGDRDDVSPFIWAGAGFVFGAILGALTPQEHWKRVFPR